MPTTKGKYTTLVDAATRLFAQEGYDGITTLAIAKGAEVTEPLIYYYFEGKSGIYAQCVRAAHDLYRDILRELPGSAKPAVRLNALIEAHHRFAKERPFEAALIFRRVPPNLESDREDLEKLVSGARDAVQKSFGACIRDGIADGTFADASVSMTAGLIALMLSQLFATATEKSATAAGSALKAFCRRGLEARAI